MNNEFHLKNQRWSSNNYLWAITQTVTHERKYSRSLIRQCALEAAILRIPQGLSSEEQLKVHPNDWIRLGVLLTRAGWFVVSLAESATGIAFRPWTLAELNEYESLMKVWDDWQPHLKKHVGESVQQIKDRIEDGIGHEYEAVYNTKEKTS